MLTILCKGMGTLPGMGSSEAMSERWRVEGG